MLNLDNNKTRIELYATPGSPGAGPLSMVRPDIRGRALSRRIPRGRDGGGEGGASRPNRGWPAQEFSRRPGAAPVPDSELQELGHTTVCVQTYVDARSAGASHEAAMEAAKVAQGVKTAIGIARICEKHDATKGERPKEGKSCLTLV
eukprot:SAG31_NODE_292_length_18283_cov_10.859859_3_plen_147_part_00